jgi:RNA polymerase sigma-70 factor (ECF subfamily)
MGNSAMAKAGIADEAGEIPRDDLGATIDAALPRIFGYILVRVGGDRTTAEDLTQETMLALARAWQTERLRIADPLAWLFGTARFKVIDYYRAKPAPTEDIAALDERIAAIGPIDDFERVLSRTELEAELARLPERQRLALILHYADGLPMNDVAEALGISPHAVESLLARGRRSIRANRKQMESEL